MKQPNATTRRAALASLLACAALIPTAVADPVPPQIQNLVAAQRPGTFFVDITYNLIDSDSSNVQIMIEASSTGGEPYLLPIWSLSGDVGRVTPGTNKKIVWNAWNDWAGNFTDTARIKIVADDTASAIPAPPTPPPNPELVWIPSGSFNMSGTMTYLAKGFWMGRCEVKQSEYEAVMGENPSAHVGPHFPVDSATWAKAVEYCQKLTTSEQTAGRLPAGWTYRLPTEAEWAYSYRAGTTTEYFYGDDPNRVRLRFYAWYSANSSGTTHVVGTKGPNRWGLYDMAGNVFEWCSDWYGGLPGGNVTDPTGPASGSYRAIRGGCFQEVQWEIAWNNSHLYDSFLKASERFPYSRGYQVPSQCSGFRVVMAEAP